MTPVQMIWHIEYKTQCKYSYYNTNDLDEGYLFLIQVQIHWSSNYRYIHFPCHGYIADNTAYYNDYHNTILHQIQDHNYIDQWTQALKNINYATRRSRTRDTVKLTACVCVCLCVCVRSSCNITAQTVAM